LATEKSERFFKGSKNIKGRASRKSAKLAEVEKIYPVVFSNVLLGNPRNFFARIVDWEVIGKPLNTQVNLR
jgi:hypothetical protein